MTFPSTKMAVFVDGKLFLRLPSMKSGKIVDGKVYLAITYLVQ